VAVVRVQIEGEPGTITAHAFLAAIDNSLKILIDLDSGISGEPRGTLDWLIARLGVGSLTVELESRSRIESRNTGPEVARHFVEGLRQIEQLGTSPPYLSEQGMVRAARLVKLIGREGAAGLAVTDLSETAELSAKAAVNIDQLLRTRRRAIGSVRGKIETVSIHRGQKFIIYLSRTHKAVTCRISDPQLLKEAAKVMGRRVLASGTVHYNAKNEPMRVDVEQLRVFREENELPGISELAGSDPDFTGGLSTKEYIREMRSA
jgi:hypothetical protein